MQLHAAPHLDGGWPTAVTAIHGILAAKVLAAEERAVAKAPVDVPLELQSLVRQLHGAHIVIDRDYTILAANPAYRESSRRTRRRRTPATRFRTAMRCRATGR